MKRIFHSGHFILVSWLVALCVSCTDLGVEPQPVNLIPLKAGNTWTFARTWYDSLGNVIQSATENLWVRADTNLFGHGWSVIWRDAAMQLFRNTLEGVVVRLLDYDDPKTHVLYKYPARVGDSYGYPVPTFGGTPYMSDTTWTAIVVCTDTLITVPAGSFKCVVYSVSTDYYWFYILEFISIDYGWVKQETFSRNRVNKNVFRTNSLELTSLRIIP